ncbi:ABC transporter permease [Marinobacterium litorale]|uniref:ABC transporter permease n=1 Tax=Marinobacterium litorale TaxID=404770 RepID=UPI00040E8759|nr:ABC transporter permease [Marinobacterium litorale]
MISLIKVLWLYRGFVLGSIKREFQTKYLNSLLGVSWVFIQPLSMILVYTLVFSQVMKTRLPEVDNTFGYSIYLCAGLLTWGFFVEVVSRFQNVFIDNSNLLKKVSFPRLCLPVVLVGSAGLNFCIIFSLFLVFLVLSSSFPGLVFIQIIPVLIVQLVFSVGLGMVIGVLNVFFRDVGQMTNVVLQFWFWLTPIVYPVSILPEYVRYLMNFNPLYQLVGSYQRVLVQGLSPNWDGVGAVFVVGLTLCALGLRLFKRNSGDIVDEL